MAERLTAFPETLANPHFSSTNAQFSSKRSDILRCFDNFPKTIKMAHMATHSRGNTL